MPINWKTTISPTGANQNNELVFPQELLFVSSQTTDGMLVSALALPWMEIYRQLSTNPNLITQFASQPRVFEEFIAATYDRAGFNVTITPRSGDLGRDVIAEKPGFLAVRIIDQCKAYSKDHVVTPNDVRAMMGVLLRDHNASKAVVTTTSSFAPSVATEWSASIPNRLELRDGNGLLQWIDSLKPSD